MSSGSGKLLPINSLGDHIKIALDPRIETPPATPVLDNALYSRMVRIASLTETGPTRLPDSIIFRLDGGDSQSGLDTTKSSIDMTMRIVVQNPDGTISKMTAADQQMIDDVTTGKKVQKVTGDVATPSPIPAHTGFSDEFIKYGDVVIPVYNQLHNYAAYMQYLLDEGAEGLNLNMPKRETDKINFQEYANLEAGNRTAYTSAYLDTPGHFDDVFGNIGENDGLWRRRSKWGMSDVNTVRYPLSKYPNFKDQRFVPPGLPIQLHKVVANTNQFLLSVSPTKVYKLQILSAHLNAALTKFTPAGLKQYQQILNRKGYVCRYLQPSISVHPILTGTKQFDLLIGDAEHTLPQQVHWAFVAEDALIGNHGRNSYEFKMPKFDGIKMKSMDGQVFVDIPTFSHVADKHDTNQLYTNFRLNRDSQEMRDRHNSIPKWIWEKGYGIFR